MWKTMATFLLCCLGSARAEKPAEKRAQKTEGMRLLETYQCPRCHEGTGLPAVRQEKHCVSCHQSILKGTFPIDSATLKTWQSHLHSLNAAPSFVGIGKRLRRDFVKDFLLRPYDVRSGLPAMMPRLGISETQAAAIAQALIPHEQLDLPKGDAEAGRKLVAMLGCAACHNMGGFPGMESAQKPAALRAAYDAQTVLPLAPDLRCAGSVSAGKARAISFVSQRHQARYADACFWLESNAGDGHLDIFMDCAAVSCLQNTDSQTAPNPGAESGF